MSSLPVKGRPQVKAWSQWVLPSVTSVLLLECSFPKGWWLSFPQGGPGPLCWYFTSRALEFPYIPPCLSSQLIWKVFTLFLFYLWFSLSVCGLALNEQEEREVPVHHQTSLEPYKCPLETLGQLNAYLTQKSNHLLWPRFEPKLTLSLHSSLFYKMCASFQRSLENLLKTNVCFLNLVIRESERVFK